jgi:sulfite exporter TauE/SafE
MSLLAESLLLGLVQSLHCAGMCGPLAACSGPAGALPWHAGRALSYVAAGAVAGSIGGGLGADRLATPAAVAALVLATGLLASAAFGERVLALPILRGPARKALGVAMRLPAATRGLALGAASVLLPCGLLWLALAAAAIAGGPAAGAAAMLGFMLGSAPLLVGAQLGYASLPRGLRRALPFVASLILLWRSVQGFSSHTCCG